MIHDALLPFDPPHMCPECRAGKRWLSGTDISREHDWDLTYEYECIRCGWTTERSGVRW